MRRRLPWPDTCLGADFSVFPFLFLVLVLDLVPLHIFP